MSTNYNFLTTKVFGIEVFNLDKNKRCWYDRFLPCDEKSEQIKIGDIVDIHGEKYSIAGCGTTLFREEFIPMFLAVSFEEGKRPEWMERDYPHPDYHSIDDLFRNYCPFE